MKPMKLTLDPNNPLTETVFEVRATGDSDRQSSVEIPQRNGRILEVTDFWDENLAPITIERYHAKLVGCVTFERGKGLEPSVMRVFDYFTGMTGKGGAKAPVLYHGKEFRIDVYNLEEEQRGFHRGCDEDEIWFQFRGHSLNHTEWGAMELDAGQTAMIPSGIAHRITGSPGFLRMVFYSRGLVQPKAFNNISERETRFEVQ